MAEMTTPGRAPHEAEIPQQPDNAVLGLWIWLSAESIFFATLIGTYLIMRPQLNHGPGPHQIFDLQLTFAVTIILLTSSLTMALGLSQIQKGNVGRLRLWLVISAVLGLAFVGGQALEFHHYYMIHVTMQSSPFASAFYTLVGFHGLHVLFGSFWLISVLVFSFKPEFLAESVTKVRVLGLYWHFVDVVWVIIFSVIYLMGKVG